MTLETDQKALLQARSLLRVARTGTLATLDSGTGFPHASLVAVASAPCGSPLLLLSGLARHTANLLADSRSSLLLASTEAGDPLTLPRISLRGRLQRTDEPGLRERYLTRHPGAAGFAGFADFALYRMTVESGYLVAGFGRIVDLPAAALLTDLDGADDVVASETRIAEHMNDDHLDATELYATRLLGRSGGGWRFVGCDPDGIEIARETEVLRLPFDVRALTATDVRVQLVELVRKARALT